MIWQRSKTLCCIQTNPVLHRSIIFRMVVDDSKKADLEDVLKLKNTNEIVNTPRRGETPLHFAARANAKECLQLLLDNGAVPVPNGEGDTPLHFAAYDGASDCIKIILKSGTLPMSNDEGMFHELPMDDLEVIQILLTAKTKETLPLFSIQSIMSQKNLRGQTVLEAADESTSEEMKETLRKLDGIAFISISHTSRDRMSHLLFKTTL